MTEDQILIIQKHYENLNKLKEESIRDVKKNTDGIKEE